MIVGLSGYAQSGKDTVAGILAEHHGFERRAFADVLRTALYKLNPWITAQTETCVRRVRYAQLIDDLGYEGARRTPYGPEIRRLLQCLGTEVGRNIIGANTWVDAAMRALDLRSRLTGPWPNGAYVFTDVRFPNEAHAIKAAGGEVWRIERPGYGPVNDHPSETALDGWDFDVRIVNDGDIDLLAAKVQFALDTWGEVSA